MIKMCKVSKRVAFGYHGNIRKSYYGYIPGVLSPNEAGQLNRKWFDETKEKEEKLFIRRTLQLISGITGCPILIKNLMNTVRIKEIRSVFPNSRFIFISRKPLFTAQSILWMRRRLTGGDDQWYGVKPLGYEDILDQDPFFQVLWQIISLEKLVHGYMKKFPKSFFKIKYEDFCREPQKIIDRLRGKFNLKRRNSSKLINKNIITMRNKISLEMDEWKKLSRIYHEMID